ncbi:MAG: hypothetical protein VB139_00425 [Coriobacteriia bacterium]|nr:hypothetical protein [Coriobacteriia bacterium]
MGEAWVSMAAFFVSLAATLIALAAVAVSYIAYRSQSDADVIVYVEHDELRRTILNIVVENVGAASAFNCNFVASAPIPADAFGLEAESAPAAAIMDAGPLVTGIAFLPPGGRRRITWGQPGGLIKAVGDSTIEVTATFESEHYGRPGRIKHKVTYPLEISSFLGTDASDTNYLKHIDESLKKIAATADRLAK